MCVCWMYTALCLSVLPLRGGFCSSLFYFIIKKTHLPVFESSPASLQSIPDRTNQPIWGLSRGRVCVFHHPPLSPAPYTNASSSSRPWAPAVSRAMTWGSLPWSSVVQQRGWGTMRQPSRTSSTVPLMSPSAGGGWGGRTTWRLGNLWRFWHVPQLRWLVCLRWWATKLQFLVLLCTAASCCSFQWWPMKLQCPQWRDDEAAVFPVAADEAAAPPRVADEASAYRSRRRRRNRRKASSTLHDLESVPEPAPFHEPTESALEPAPQVVVICSTVVASCSACPTLDSCSAFPALAPLSAYSSGPSSTPWAWPTVLTPDPHPPYNFLLF